MMDKCVIRKIIEHCGEPCPSFKYDNPLLDKNIAILVAKGFMKLLNKEDSGDSSNNSDRLLLLNNIRKCCKVEPPGHLYIDDNVIDILRNTYEKLPGDNNIFKDLDSFLIRNLKEINISSCHTPSFKPDIIKALINLNEDKQEIRDILLKDIINWNTDDSKENSCLDILKSIWNEECMYAICKTQSDDISIKMKPLIESILLRNALQMLDTIILDEDEWFKNQELEELVTICSISSECFQICCSIMNTIFINTDFNIQMNKFIVLFIASVKLKVEYISQLYPSNLQHIALLLDIELNQLQGELKEMYIASTLEHLNSLHKECDSDLIMLLSHFNKWFDLYYDSKLK